MRGWREDDRSWRARSGYFGEENTPRVHQEMWPNIWAGTRSRWTLRGLQWTQEVPILQRAHTGAIPGRQYSWMRCFEVRANLYRTAKKRSQLHEEASGGARGVARI